MIDILKITLKGLVILSLILALCLALVLILDYYGLIHILIGGLGLLCILLMSYILGGISEL